MVWYVSRGLDPSKVDRLKPPAPPTQPIALLVAKRSLDAISYANAYNLSFCFQSKLLHVYFNIINIERNV